MAEVSIGGCNAFCRVHHSGCLDAWYWCKTLITLELLVLQYNWLHYLVFLLLLFDYSGIDFETKKRITISYKCHQIVWSNYIDGY